VPAVSECDIHVLYQMYIKDIQCCFDEYEIYFMSETKEFHENSIKILSHEWNKFHIHQQNNEFSVYYIFFAFGTCLLQIWKVLEHNVIIRNMMSQSILLHVFSLWKSQSVKISILFKGFHSWQCNKLIYPTHRNEV
jgi:hypothetical protein